jgi:hypothetical protein
MNPNIVVSRIAEQRLQHWQTQLQIAFRTGNHEQASTCQALIEEYWVFMNQAAGQIHGQASGWQRIDPLDAPPAA